MKKIDSIDIGKRIREVRKELGMLQAEFAEKLSVEISNLSYIENGRRKVQAEFLVGLYNHYDVNINYILTGQGVMFNSQQNKAVDKRTSVEGINSQEDLIWYMNRSSILKHSVLGQATLFYAEHKDTINNNLKQEHQEDSASEDQPEISPNIPD